MSIFVSTLPKRVLSAVPTFVTAVTTASEMNPGEDLVLDEILALLVAKTKF